MEKINGYSLLKSWFAFAFENPSKVRPIHGALYSWLVELNNRMGWAKEFASPASQSMAACGIGSYHAYKKALDELVDFGFVKVVKRSINQYTACVFALVNFDKAPTKADTKAIDKALSEHLPKHGQSTVQSNDSIIKQETTNRETEKQRKIALFPAFYDAYGKKKSPADAERAWLKLSLDIMPEVIAAAAVVGASYTKDRKKYQPYPATWLNDRGWEDDDIRPKMDVCVAGFEIDREKHPNWDSQFPYKDTNIYRYQHGMQLESWETLKSRGQL